MSDGLAGYSVIITRTLNIVGRFHSPASAEQFVRDVTAPGTGHVRDLEWNTTVTVMRLEPEAGDE